MSNHVICLAEDRPFAETGLRVLILSLAKHAPGIPVVLYRPGASSEFQNWLHQFPLVRWIPKPPHNAFDWNCKPQAMLPLFNEGFNRVTWLDSDLMLNRSIEPILESIEPRTLVLAQDSPVTNVGEYTLGSRTRAWGWVVVRDLPMTLNSCVLSTTRAHVDLLKAWLELMQTRVYQEWAEQPIELRPPGFVGDQEVLAALLGGPRFSNVPLRILKTGSEVVHCAGARSFSSTDRCRWLMHGPAFVLHATSGKPWTLLNPTFTNDYNPVLTKLAQQTSPYVAAARSFGPNLGEPAQWLDYRTPLGVVLRAVGFGNAALRGWPLTGLIELCHFVKRCAGSKGRPKSWESSASAKGKHSIN